MLEKRGLEKRGLEKRGRTVRGAIFQSLDGVIQAPGGPGEDPTGGFAHGGWMFPLADEAVGEAIGALFAEPFELLLGRRTYDIFASYWPYHEGEDRGIADVFNRIAKHVLTRDDAPLEWANSHRLSGIDALAALRARDGADLVIQGSATLYPQLLAAGLIDRVTIMTFPVVLGGGKRLFGEGTPPVTLEMVEHRVSPRGTVIATYEPAGAVTVGSFGDAPVNARETARQGRMARGDW